MGREKREWRRKSKKMDYRTFRANLRYMKGDDLERLPLIWLEDMLLSPSSSEEKDEEKGNIKHNNSHRSNKTCQSLPDPSFQKLLRNHRGTGLALLIADPQCRTSLIEKCYPANGGRCRHGGMLKKSTASSVMLTRKKSATLIEEGGEVLAHCAITGFDSHPMAASALRKPNGATVTKVPAVVETLGTTYFLKFDSGKMHHRGDLPLNLAARLQREGRNGCALRYLSTGCVYSSSSSRCYYAEFDNGECWWGTDKDDALDKVFTEMDVHRVAFGVNTGGGGNTFAVNAPNESSWVVLGKDGSVRWKNVPPGLHDALLAQGAGISSAVVSAADRLDPAVTNDGFLEHGVAVAAIPRAAPCEVSLGARGAYFVRFLDGRVDYSLPNFVADAVDGLEGDGRAIRNVALHVDTYDCLIRYSMEETMDEEGEGRFVKATDRDTSK